MQERIQCLVKHVQLRDWRGTQGSRIGHYRGGARATILGIVVAHGKEPPIYSRVRPLTPPPCLHI